MGSEFPKFGRARVDSLVRSGHWREDLLASKPEDRWVWVDDDGGWLAVKARAYDSGEVSDEFFDAVQLDMLLDRLSDEVLRAAVTLRLHGFDESVIGGLLGGVSRGRTGARLVDDGVRVLAGLMEDENG